MQMHDASMLTYREVIGNYVNVRYKFNYTHGGKSKYLNKRDLGTDGGSISEQTWPCLSSHPSVFETFSSLTMM